MDQSSPPKTSELRRLREETGLSLRAVARHVDVDPAYLSRVERGMVRPSLPMLSRLFRALGVDWVADRVDADRAFIDHVIGGR